MKVTMNITDAQDFENACQITVYIEGMQAKEAIKRIKKCLKQTKSANKKLGVKLIR